MKYAGLLLGCLFVITASALQAMPQSRTPEPLKITTPTIDARRAWVSQPLVQVENVSNKTIEYLTIQTMLPGVKEPFMLAFGQQPGKPADKNVQPLLPGAKVNLSVDQHACELIKKSSLRVDADSLNGNHATTKINGVIYNDQTAWFYGLPHVMEPNNPLRWNPVRSTSKASKPTDSPMFSFLKVGLREDRSMETNQTICWDVVGTFVVDCCGIEQASTFMNKGTGEWFPVDHYTSCCIWTEPTECL